MGTQTAGGGAGPAVQRARITVTYTDGRTDSVTLRPVGLIAAERHFKGTPPQVEGTLYAAWWQLSREQDGELPNFGDWLDDLDAIAEEVIGGDPPVATDTEQ